jgi:hypothetical protein
MFDLQNLNVSSTPKNVSMTNYEVYEQHKLPVDGVKWYSVNCSFAVTEWLNENFVAGTDFYPVRQLKGTWVDMPESTLILLKLRW